MIKNTPIVTYVGETNPFDLVDYQAEGVELTTTQFKNRDVFGRYLELLLYGYKGLGEVLQDLMQNRSLETAQGVQLDIIGKILGQPRQLFDSAIIRYFGFNGVTGASPYKSVSNTERTYGPWKGVRDTLLGVRELTDAEYRRILLLKIVKNTSDANVTAFNDGVRLLFGVDNVDYQEATPVEYTEGSATLTISIGRDYNDPEKAAFPGLDEIALAEQFLNKPIGVGILFQNPITLSANFVTQNYQQFVFGGETALSIVPFEDMFTFERPYTADYYDSAGVLQTAPINTPRFDHDPTTKDSLGLLIEGPNEILRHTWGLEVNDTQGTIRLVLEHLNTSGKEVAMVLEGQDFKLVLFRENTYWKIRVEYSTTENYEMIISQNPSDTLVTSIAYTPKSVFFRIEDEDRYTTMSVDFNATNVRGFDLRFGGEFTTNVGDTYNHFNGLLKELIYLRPYIGDNQDAVVDGMQINTEDYNKILTEFNAIFIT